MQLNLGKVIKDIKIKRILSLFTANTIGDSSNTKESTKLLELIYVDLIKSQDTSQYRKSIYLLILAISIWKFYDLKKYKNIQYIWINLSKYEQDIESANIIDRLKNIYI